MGQSTSATLKIGGKSQTGEALLETNAIIFRGDPRRTFPFGRRRSLAAKAGRLTFTFDGAPVTLQLGPVAAKWLDRIRNPKPVIDKLGVKPGASVAVLALDDRAFAKELRSRAATVSGRVARTSDIIFLGATAPKDLRRLATIEKGMRRDAALWVVWPKGRPELREDHVRAEALRCGLVDMKVVAFSASHSALKLVVPLARRS